MRTGIMRPGVGISPRSSILNTNLNLVKPCIRQLGCVARLSQRPDNSRPSDGIDEAAYKELSPAAREVFKEAQENILALNGSRMRALQELRAANEKIAELEKKLEDATTQISRLATRHTSITAEPEQHASTKTSSTSISTSSTPASTSLITVSYVTGWDTVYLHFQIDDQPWTSLPGLAMEDDHGTRKISVPGNRMKFVLTNGLGKFDTPNPYGDPHQPKNYEINGPGSYKLEAGKLTRLS